MGYAKEKEIVEKKVGKAKRIVFFIVLALILAVVIVSLIIPANTWKYKVGMPKIKARETGEMRLHFIDVGQGDATLVELPDGKILLVDGGNGSEEANKAILRYLNALKIERIDYAVITHADVDHFGGFPEIFEYKEVGFAYLPKVDATYSDAYAKFHKALVEEKCETSFSSRSLSIAGEGYFVRFLFPYTADVQSEGNVGGENDGSAVLWIEYQGVSTLLMGDAPKSVEEKLINDNALDFLQVYGVDLQSTEILKVAHHGSDGSTGKAFLEYIQAETAVISCGKGNPYGHPTSVTLENLSSAGVTTYRTDVSGSVFVTVKADGTYEFTTLGK